MVAVAMAGTGGVQAQISRPATRPAGTTRPTTKPTTRPAKKTKTLEQSHKAYMAGKYPEAAEGYRGLLNDESKQVAAAIGLADVLKITGKYSEAIETLQGVADKGKQNPAWYPAIIDALTYVGKYTEALQYCDAGLKLPAADCAITAELIYLRGRLLETFGRDEEARENYRKVETIIDAGKYRKNAAALVAIGKILDRYAVLSGRKASDQAPNILHNYFQEAYLKVAPDYWPANVAAAKLLLEKHNARAAVQELRLAMKLNPKIPDVYAGLGVAELHRWRFKKCLANANKALRINPHHASSLYLKAVCYMQWRKFHKVPPLLEKILETNPNSIEALSLLAAAHIRMFEPEKATPFIERVGKIDPNCEDLPLTIGVWLVSGRQFAEAEAYLKRAVELAPKKAGPIAALGTMYMQTGQEVEARKALETAHKLDDFRKDVAHYLTVAKALEKFAVKETEHFIVKVDKEHDLVLLDQVSDYMESIYPEVTGDYGFEPTQKTIVEILPFQKDFSARISGRAWLPTVGACTGRVIAITAPNRTRGVLGLHNWAQVLRHEFAHTVTLGATNNRIPHWFTEACAVWQQKDKRAFHYMKTLADATHKKRLFPVNKIDWGFITPKKRGDRKLAYAQSEWMMDYIIRTYGFETIPKMLQAFAEGKTQKQVFKEVVGVSEKQFDKDFRKWAAATVKKWGIENPDETKPKGGVLGGIFGGKKKPNPAKVAAKKAKELLGKRKFKQARGQAAKALKTDPKNQTALRVLSQCYLHDKRWADAIAAMETLRDAHPFDSFSYSHLAKIYVQLGQPEKALPNLIYLHRHTMNDPKYARQIAETYRSLKQYDSAAKYFREVIYINPYETSATEALAGIYLKMKKYDQARAAAKNLTLLEDDSARSWNYLAMVRYRIALATKNIDELHQAREDAEKAQKLDPKGRAIQILQYIDAAIKKMQNDPTATSADDS